MKTRRKIVLSFLYSFSNFPHSVHQILLPSYCDSRCVVHKNHNACIYLCSMLDLNELDEDWEDPDEEKEGESTAEPVERMRITTGKKQEPLRIDKFLMNLV